MAATATATKSEVLELEKKYWEAMKNHDAATMQELTADPCVVVGQDGAMTMTARQLADMMKSQDYKLRSFRVDEGSAVVRELGDGVAMVAYKVHEESNRGGKDQSLDAYDSSVWVKRGNKWQCAVHTESLANPAR